MPPNQQGVPSDNLQSFKPYTGKAPVTVQIVAGLMWLGSAGIIIWGALWLLLSPILGIVTLVIGAYTIYTAKHLFSMKRDAFTHSIILAVIILIAVIYSSVSSGGNIQYANFISPILLILIAFVYRNRFVN